MEHLQRTFLDYIETLSSKITHAIETHGTEPLHHVTLQDIFKGMRGVPTIYTPTSFVNPQKGAHYRSLPIKDALVHLPPAPHNNTNNKSKTQQAQSTTAEALFWYLLTGQIPQPSEVEQLQMTLKSRATVPQHVYRAIDTLPKRTRPMTRYCIGVLSWTTSSFFQDSYDRGLDKKEFWKYYYHDALNLIAGAPHLVSYIYRNHSLGEDTIDPNITLDWAANLAYMMGFEDPVVHELFRLFVFCHADHGASNVSAYTSRIIGSSLANIYYCYSGSMLGLSGPLHGHANEEVVSWIDKLFAFAQNNQPNESTITDFVTQTLDSGQVIPGFGHASLSIEDPRFSLFLEFVHSHSITSPYIEVVKKLCTIVPPILKQLGKVRNPNPNVDLITGSLLHAVGVTDKRFFTVLFGISRLLGIAAQYLIANTLTLPIMRSATLSDTQLDSYATKDYTNDQIESQTLPDNNMAMSQSNQ